MTELRKVKIMNYAEDVVTGVSGTHDTIDVSISNGTYRAAIDSSGYFTININGNVTVDATDLDIRDLTSASDSVAVTTVKPDGTNTMPSLDTRARAGHVQDIVSGKNFAYADTSFVTGESPITLDINADLGKNSTKGYIANDGDGNFSVELSQDGSTWGTSFIMKKDDVLSLDGLDVDSIKLTWIANSAYRVVIW